jgi:hypothetical protein
MKMIFEGGESRLLMFWSMFDKILEKNYKKEYDRGECKLYFTEKTLVIESKVPKFTDEMKKDFFGIKGRIKRMQLRAIGVKVKLEEA